MTIGRIDINEKDLAKICRAVIELAERSDSSGSGGGTSIGSSPGGRLTLQTLTPVMTTTQSGKTTLYYTPYNGSAVPIYDGTNFTATSFSELSALTTDATKSPAAIGASKVNDWFVWSDSGTLRLGHGPDWTSDTARSAGTALVMVSGILLNSLAITNGPAASRGTFVGTTRSDGASQLNWIFGDVAAGGTGGFLWVWNAYNRRLVTSRSSDTTDSWTYATATWRPSNNSTSMRCSFVTGLTEDAYIARFQGRFQGSATGAAVQGVGLDSTTVVVPGAAAANPANVDGMTPAFLMGDPVLGSHFVQALEISNVGTATFYGDVNDPTVQQNSLTFTGFM